MIKMRFRRRSEIQMNRIRSPSWRPDSIARGGGCNRSLPILGSLSGADDAEHLGPRFVYVKGWEYLFVPGPNGLGGLIEQKF